MLKKTIANIFVFSGLLALLSNCNNDGRIFFPDWKDTLILRTTKPIEYNNESPQIDDFSTTTNYLNLSFYLSSKPVKINGKEYYPLLRLFTEIDTICYLRCKDNKIYILSDKYYDSKKNVSWIKENVFIDFDGQVGERLEFYASDGETFISPNYVTIDSVEHAPDDVILHCKRDLGKYRSGIHFIEGQPFLSSYVISKKKGLIDMKFGNEEEKGYREYKLVE